MCVYNRYSVLTVLEAAEKSRIKESADFLPGGCLLPRLHHSCCVLLMSEKGLTSLPLLLTPLSPRRHCGGFIPMISSKLSYLPKAPLINTQLWELGVWHMNWGGGWGQKQSIPNSTPTGPGPYKHPTHRSAPQCTFLLPREPPRMAVWVTLSSLQ